MTSGRRSGRAGQSGSRRSRAASSERAVDEPLRLNRFIASTGFCSRRKADELIEQGRVFVNGSLVTDFSTQVSAADAVAVNGRLITPAGFQYILLNKPADTITTTDDEKGRRTVLDLIGLSEGEKRGLYPVGRLDRHTVGVLLLTNDGELAHRLMHPSYEIDKLYLAQVDKQVSNDHITRLMAGLKLEDGPARADYAHLPDPTDTRKLGISIHEGRNRQVRRMIESLGFQVVKLERIRYAGLTSKGLRRGKWRRLKEHEVRSLYRKVRLKTK